MGPGEREEEEGKWFNGSTLGRLQAMASGFTPSGRGGYSGKVGGGIRQPSGPYEERTPGGTLTAWYSRAGYGEGNPVGYYVGSEPEMEQLLGIQLGWDPQGEQGLYEFLSQAASGDKAQYVISPKMDEGLAARVFQRLLGDALQQGR